MARVQVANVPLQSVTGAPALRKPYRTFSEFYNFYLTEHTDLTVSAPASAFALDLLYG